MIPSTARGCRTTRRAGQSRAGSARLSPGVRWTRATRAPPAVGNPVPGRGRCRIPERMAPVPILIAAHVCSMLGFATFAALLPQLRDTWSLTNAQAGVVGGMFFGGYIASVSYWTALTDRGDGRKVYAAGALFAAAGSAGFAALARGFWSGIFFQALLGVGIAGTYMPGLRLLSDRVSAKGQSRS